MGSADSKPLLASSEVAYVPKPDEPSKHPSYKDHVRKLVPL
jgi:hypothetical protein